MVGEIRIYFEGDPALRPGFRRFLAELFALGRARRCRVGLIATRATAAEDFENALKSHPEAWCILLRDSEGPDDGKLLARFRLPKTRGDSVFWMVQVMEAWFLADCAALEAYYGKGFLTRALPRNPAVERIPKTDLIRGLRRATRNTQKGIYHKTEHAPGLLASIDPAKVRQAAAHCNRLFDAVTRRLNSLPDDLMPLRAARKTPPA
jgi:hypothetical protein